MGCKLVKEHFGIDALVHQVAGDLFIGEGPSAPFILAFTPQGQPYAVQGPSHPRFQAYRQALEADRQTFAMLFTQPDELTAPVTLYRCKDGVVSAHQAPALADGEVTADGTLVLEKLFFTSEDAAAQDGWERGQQAFQDVEADILLLHSGLRFAQAKRKSAAFVQDLTARLAQMTAERAQTEAALARLAERYPLL